MEFISKQFNGIEVFFQKENNDIFINATKIALLYNKDLSNWIRSPDTIAYVKELEEIFNSVNSTELKLIFTKQGKYGGTWIHKKLIIAFARWIDPKFAVWCDIQIEELLKNSSTQKQTPIFDISSFSSEKLLDVQKTLFGLETAIKILKVSEASKLLMTETIYRELGIKTDFLPKYSDEKHTYSLTHLLKKFGSNISAKKVNQKLLEIGILEIKTRKSHKKEKTYQMFLELEFNNIDENNKYETIREFKSLTEKGLKFGKNLINPNNELQTQPHYFESSFAELLKLI